jgi:hypothetical protein
MGKDNVRQRVVPRFCLAEFADPTGQVHCLDVHTGVAVAAAVDPAHGPLMPDQGLALAALVRVPQANAAVGAGEYATQETPSVCPCSTL